MPFDLNLMPSINSFSWAQSFLCDI